MSIPDLPPLLDDNWFNQEFPTPSFANKRKSTRYVRRDIAITVRVIGLFSLSFLRNKETSVKLVDISSRGVGVFIATNLRLNINKQVFLIIRFSDFTEFEVPGTVVRRSNVDLRIYGIKFDNYNNELADYLLHTQKKLKFT